jgi:hypothetical protein
LARIDAEEIAGGIGAARRELRAGKPAFRELAAAIGHVFAAEDAKPQHLRGRELRFEFRIEIATGRCGQGVAVALLHLVVDGDGAPAHRRN